MNKNIIVSIICNAFNHEPYIRKALEGFVMQKTNFAFEVLIHDDASTDKTADIIREFEAKYPEIIKPIYQTENQYSKGLGLVSKIQYGRVTGKYIAICEGDDCWTDPLKLQKQVDALEAHPEADMCAHRAQCVQNGQVVEFFPKETENKIFSAEEVIAGGGGFVATASLMYRTAILKQQWKFRECLRLDYTLQIQGALRGGILYLSDCMSVYNFMTETSWTKRMRKDASKVIQHLKKVVDMLQILDEETDRQYSDVIAKVKTKEEFNISQLAEQWKELKNEEYSEIFKALPLKERIKINIKIYFPFVTKLLKKIRG